MREELKKGGKKKTEPDHRETESEIREQQNQHPGEQ